MLTGEVMLYVPQGRFISAPVVALAATAAFRAAVSSCSTEVPDTEVRATSANTKCPVCAPCTIDVTSQSACAALSGVVGIKPGRNVGVQPVSIQPVSVLAPS